MQYTLNYVLILVLMDNENTMETYVPMSPVSVVLILVLMDNENTM